MIRQTLSWHRVKQLAFLKILYFETKTVKNGLKKCNFKESKLEHEIDFFHFWCYLKKNLQKRIFSVFCRLQLYYSLLVKLHLSFYLIKLLKAEYDKLVALNGQFLRMTLSIY